MGGTFLRRLLISAYPPSIRRTHGAEMADACAASWRARRTWTSRVRFIVDLIGDVLSTWSDVRRRARRRNAGPAGSRTPLTRHLSSDVRDAMRLFRRAPLFGLGAVLVLALGTGATAAILSLANATLLRPLPIPDPARVLQSTFSFSYLDFRALSTEHRSFTQVAAWSYSSFGVEHGDEVVQASGAAVSGDYFALAGQSPVFGRLLGRSDDEAGAPAVAVISERLWTRAFERDPRLIGGVVNINRRPVMIVGVSPAAFRGTSLQVAPELFVNLTSLPVLSTGFLADPETMANRGRVFLNIAGRLADGATAAQANDDARRIYYTHRTAAEKDTSLWFAPLLTQAIGVKTGGDLRRFMLILVGASAMSILLTCATIANLLLVRSERRRHEMAVRAALGAGRARLYRLLLVESLGIGVSGGLAGVGVANVTLSLLASYALPGQIAIRDLRLTVDPAMLAACAAIGILTALVFGLAPIWSTRHVDASGALHLGARATSRQPLRSLLVGVQVGLCVLLMGGSLAFGRAIAHALALDLGFSVSDTSITAVDPSLARLSSQRSAEIRRESLAILRARPWVRAASWALIRPMSGGFVITPVVEGAAAPAGAKPVSVQANVVTDGYFATMGIPIVAGRELTAVENGPGERVAVISAALAKTFWPSGDAVGHRFSLEDPGSTDMKWRTVVGISADIHRSMGGPAVPMLYVPDGQTPEGFSPGYLVVRTTGDPSTALPEIRAVLRGVEPHVAITSSMLMADHVRAPLMAHRLGLRLFLLFAGLAMTLTAIGLYAVVATAVSQRAREIGIRVALGAEDSRVIWMVARQGVWPIAAGLVAGIAACAMSARVIQGFMFSLPAISPSSLLTTCAAIVVIAIVAMTVPARRALSIDPTVILRTD